MDPAVFRFYALLGVHAQSTDDDIRAAYRAKARQLHPDKGGRPDDFAAIAHAYRAVGTAARRADLRALLQLAGHACPSCGGEGATRRSTGFTTVQLTACTHCGGCGALPR